MATLSIPEILRAFDRLTQAGCPCPTQARRLAGRWRQALQELPPPALDGHIDAWIQESAPAWPSLPQIADWQAAPPAPRPTPSRATPSASGDPAARPLGLYDRQAATFVEPMGPPPPWVETWLERPKANHCFVTPAQGGRYTERHLHQDAAHLGSWAAFRDFLEDHGEHTRDTPRPSSPRRWELVEPVPEFVPPKPLIAQEPESPSGPLFQGPPPRPSWLKSSKKDT